MRTNRSGGWKRLAAVLAVAGLAVAGCGDDDDTDAADATTTTEEAGDTGTTEPAEDSGDGEVDEEFCTALGADLDAIDAIVDSYETGGPSEAIVQEARDANDALRDATPDGLTDDASAIYEPLGELIDSLESGDTDDIATEYAATVSSPAFTEPLTSLSQRCAALVTAG
jgi:hypothetical protein